MLPETNLPHNIDFETTVNYLDRPCEYSIFKLYIYIRMYRYASFIHLIQQVKILCLILLTEKHHLSQWLFMVSTERYIDQITVRVKEIV